MDKVMHQKGLVCVIDLVTHIVCWSKAMYKNTKYKDMWLFYHNALSLINAKETVTWTKTQKVREGSDVKFHDKWIFPQNRLNTEYKQFKNRLIGNSPEICHLKLPHAGPCLGSCQVASSLVSCQLAYS